MVKNPIYTVNAIGVASKLQASNYLMLFCRIWERNTEWSTIINAASRTKRTSKENCPLVYYQETLCIVYTVTRPKNRQMGTKYIWIFQILPKPLSYSLFNNLTFLGRLRDVEIVDVCFRKAGYLTKNSPNTSLLILPGMKSTGKLW